MKRCSKCGELKPLEEFNTKKASRDGKQSQCKPCSVASAKAWNESHPEIHRERSRRGEHYAKHGFTEDEWDNLVESLESKCQLCGTQISKPYADHDHSSGLVRGVLCTHCNRGLGAFFDSPDLLMKAIEYLNNPPLAYMNKISRYSIPAKTPHGWKNARNPRTKK